MLHQVCTAKRPANRYRVLHALCAGAAAAVVALRLQEFPLKLILFKRKHVQLVEFLFLIEYRQNKYAYAVVCAALSLFLSRSQMCVWVWIFCAFLFMSHSFIGPFLSYDLILPALRLDLFKQKRHESSLHSHIRPRALWMNICKIVIKANAERERDLLHEDTYNIECFIRFYISVWPVLFCSVLWTVWFSTSWCLLKAHTNRECVAKHEEKYWEREGR